MKEITFKGKQYRLPENWSDITVKMVMETDRLNEIAPDIPLLTILSSYTGIQLKEITSASAQELEPLLDEMEFIYTPYSATPINYFEFKGVTYLAKENILDEPFSTWVSIQTILYNYKNDPVKGLPRMIAVLCKKDGETLDDINVTERAKLFENLPITIAKDVEGFFLNSLQALSVITSLSSIQGKLEEGILQQCQELNNIMKKRAAENGGSWFTKLQIGYYRMYLWYLKHLLVRYFNSTHTGNSKKKWKPMWKKFFIKKLKEKINE